MCSCGVEHEDMCQLCCGGNDGICRCDCRIGDVFVFKEDCCSGCVLLGRQVSTQSSSDSVRLRCLIQIPSYSVVRMTFGGVVCHALMLPFRWEQTGASCSHGVHIGARRMISWDCCVIDVVSSVAAPSAGLVDTRGGEGNCQQSR